MRDLPPFKRRNRDEVIAFLGPLFADQKQPEVSHLIDVREREDGHYRVFFEPGYFVLSEGQTEPTKSQWNSLKKKLKRHESDIFVFKDHGEADGQYYLDIGFLPTLPPANKRPHSARR